MAEFKYKFVWVPEYVEDGDPSCFGWRWLVFGWYYWFEGRYNDYWRPVTHKF